MEGRLLPERPRGRLSARGDRTSHLFPWRRTQAALSCYRSECRSRVRSLPGLTCRCNGPWRCSQILSVSSSPRGCSRLGPGSASDSPPLRLRQHAVLIAITHGRPCAAQPVGTGFPGDLPKPGHPPFHRPKDQEKRRPWREVWGWEVTGTLLGLPVAPCVDFEETTAQEREASWDGGRLSGQKHRWSRRGRAGLLGGAKGWTPDPSGD